MLRVDQVSTNWFQKIWLQVQNQTDMKRVFRWFSVQLTVLDSFCVYASWFCIRAWFLLVSQRKVQKKSKSTAHTYARHARFSPKDMILKHQTWLRCDTQWLDSKGSSVWCFAEFHATGSSILRCPGDRICWCIRAEATWFKAHRLSRWGLESDWFRAAMLELLDLFGFVWICTECSCAMRLREVLDDCTMLGPADVAVRAFGCYPGEMKPTSNVLQWKCCPMCQTLHIASCHFHIWSFIGDFVCPWNQIEDDRPKIDHK